MDESIALGGDSDLVNTVGGGTSTRRHDIRKEQMTIAEGTTIAVDPEIPMQSSRTALPTHMAVGTMISPETKQPVEFNRPPALTSSIQQKPREAAGSLILGTMPAPILSAGSSPATSIIPLANLPKVERVIVPTKTIQEGNIVPGSSLLNPVTSRFNLPPQRQQAELIQPGQILFESLKKQPETRKPLETKLQLSTLSGEIFAPSQPTPQKQPTVIQDVEMTEMPTALIGISEKPKTKQKKTESGVPENLIYRTVYYHTGQGRKADKEILLKKTKLINLSPDTVSVFYDKTISDKINKDLIRLPDKDTPISRYPVDTIRPDLQIVRTDNKIRVTTGGDSALRARFNGPLVSQLFIGYADDKAEFAKYRMVTGKTLVTRCSFVKENRQRCKSITAKNYIYCWIHLAQSLHLYIAPGGAAGSGEGIYAIDWNIFIAQNRKTDVMNKLIYDDSVVFEGGQKITYLAGELMTNDLLQKRYGKRYVNTVPYAYRVIQMNESEGDIFYDCMFAKCPASYVNDRIDMIYVLILSIRDALLAGKVVGQVIAILQGNETDPKVILQELSADILRSLLSLDNLILLSPLIYKYYTAEYQRLETSWQNFIKSKSGGGAAINPKNFTKSENLPKSILQTANAALKKDPTTGDVWLVARRNIHHGEEIFIYYGSSFWQGLNIVMELLQYLIVNRQLILKLTFQDNRFHYPSMSLKFPISLPSSIQMQEQPVEQVLAVQKVVPAAVIPSTATAQISETSLQTIQ